MPDFKAAIAVVHGKIDEAERALSLYSTFDVSDDFYSSGKKFQESDFDRIEAVNHWTIPARFALHMEILSQEFTAFRSGDEAGLPISLARMNAILVGGDELGEGPIVVDETENEARAACGKWLGKLRAHIEAIGAMPPTDSRRKVFICAKIILEKLERFVSEGRSLTKDRAAELDGKISNVAEWLSSRERFPGKKQQEFLDRLNRLGVEGEKEGDDQEMIHDKIPSAFYEWIFKTFPYSAETVARDFMMKWKSFDAAAVSRLVDRKPWMVGAIVVGSVKNTLEILEIDEEPSSLSAAD